jgi:hypothetical protein
MSTLSTLPVYQGFLYRIFDEKNTEVGYLAGTCHAFLPSDQDCSFNDEMNTAIQKSETIYLETNPFNNIENTNMTGVNKIEALEALNLLSGIEISGIERKILNIVLTIKKKLKGLESIEQRQAIELRVQKAHNNVSEDIMKLSPEKQEKMYELFRLTSAKI